MKKNINSRSYNHTAGLFHVINHKRSQKWLSDETKLLNKYGLSSRYMDLYVL